MNNYQIYEELGRGRHSIVYKGRKKRSIEYFAIASIEKTQRQRVLNSVQFLRGLNHKNVLKFHNWYETNNHLWVITEYCTGGSLKDMLHHENRLPESTTKIYGQDLLEGLLYIHAKGVLYADLKPSNVLMDECATLRFYDFGLSHSVETAAKGARVGTPAYMAPELFREGGVHSYASDLWSLGCLLHELAVGQPPFVAKELQPLIQKIVNEATPKVSGYSAAFNDLLEMLLQKDPLQRGTWEDVVSNEFWHTRVTVPPLPSQPAFESYKAARPPSSQSASREAESRKRDILRASINAEKNLARELKDSGGYQPGATTALPVDREVDFSEPAADEDAADHAVNASQRDQQAEVVVVPAEPREEDGVVTPPPAPGIEIVRQNSSRALSPAPNPQSSPPKIADDIESLLPHISDTSVKPIVLNGKIEKIGDPKYEPNELSFPVKTMTQLKSMEAKDLEAFLSNVYKSLSGASSLSDKYNTLCYFETLCCDTQIANVIINSSVVGLLVRMLKMNNMPSNVCTMLATILGALLRHATYVHSDIQKTGIFPVLVENTHGNKPVKVRRRAIACLGELLFYVATQTEIEQALWHIPPEVPTAIISRLSDEDEIARHYATKTVENIASTHELSRLTVGLVSRFMLPEVVASLMGTVVAPTSVFKSDYLRSSAAASAFRLTMIDHRLLPALVQVAPPQQYGEMMTSTNARTVQALITFVNHLLAKAVVVLLSDPNLGQDHLARHIIWRSHHGGGPAPQTPGAVLSPRSPNPLQSAQAAAATLRDLLTQPDRFLGGLASALEHSLPAVRGKACLTIVLFTVVEHSFLSRCCEYKLFTYVEKLNRDRDPYVQACLGQLHGLMSKYVSNTLLRLSRLQPSPAVNVAQEEVKLVLHVLTSQTVRSRTLSDQDILSRIGSCVNSLNKFNEFVDYQQQIFQLCEVVTQDKGAILQHHMVVIQELLLPLVSFVRDQVADLRFLAVKIIHDLVSVMMAESSIYNPATKTAPSTAKLNEFALALLPLLQSLLREKEPIPLYTLKILVAFCDKSTAYLTNIANPSYIAIFIEYLQPSHVNYSVYTARVLLRALQCAGEPLIHSACEMCIVSRLSDVIRAAQAAEDQSMDPFLEPCMEAAFFILNAAQRSARDLIRNSCHEWCQTWHTLFLPFCVQQDHDCSEMAAACVNLLVQIFPEVQEQMLAQETLQKVTDCFEDLDAHRAYVALPLAQALLTCLQNLPPNLIGAFQRDEVLQVKLQEVCEEADGINNELAATCRDVVALLHHRT